MTAKDQFVVDHARQYAVAVLGRARRGAYAWRNRAESLRSRQKRTLAAQIQVVHPASRGTCGSPCIHAELRAHGLRWSQKRVARIMRRAGIVRKRLRRTQFTTNSNQPGPVAANKLNRAFTAVEPNAK